MRVGDEPRGEERAARRRSGTHTGERAGGGDPAQQPLTENRLAGTQHAVLAEASRNLSRDGHLLSGVGPGLDRDPGRVPDEGDELLVDIRVPPDLGNLEGVGLLEVGEPCLERLGDDLVVDPGRERSVRAAPDGHPASLCGRPPMAQGMGGRTVAACLVPADPEHSIRGSRRTRRDAHRRSVRTASVPFMYGPACGPGILGRSMRVALPPITGGQLGHNDSGLDRPGPGRLLGAALRSSPGLPLAPAAGPARHGRPRHRPRIAGCREASKEGSPPRALYCAGEGGRPRGRSFRSLVKTYGIQLTREERNRLGHLPNLPEARRALCASSPSPRTARPPRPERASGCAAR